MPKPKKATTPKTTKRETLSRAYELLMTIRPEVDALKLRSLPVGLPVALTIGDSIKLVGQVSHVHTSEHGAGVMFDLRPDDATAPLSSRDVRHWFAAGLEALLSHEDTPAEVCDALTQTITELGNQVGAFTIDGDMTRHILRRSFLVAEAERRNAEQGDDAE